MGWLNPDCPRCGLPMTASGWHLKSGLVCERCYKKLRKAKKRARRKRGAPERNRTPDDPV
jgi:tRNA(Ile2) C34 agmatinyltransferase TiaS